jgi:hypothetical protein
LGELDVRVRVDYDKELKAFAQAAIKGWECK